MAIKLSSITKPMIEAAKAAFLEDWPKISKFAEPELKRLANSLRDIATLAAKGEISKEEAKSLLNIHRNTTLTVLLTVEGMGLLAVERAINGALRAVAGVINEALPFKLL